MKLTDETKKKIDAFSCQELLDKWNKSALLDPWFKGETGAYLLNRIREARAQVDAGANSKAPVEL